MEFGPGGKENCEAVVGEVLHVPQNTIHRESNLGKEEQIIYVIRIGQGEPVTNVKGPEE